jgi:hypothetical protein
MSRCTLNEIKDVLLGWICNSDGKVTKCIQNFDEKISWKAEKEIRE